MSMTVSELIKHLQTLPQDLSIVELWDEGGTYHDKEMLPVVIEIVKSNNSLSYGGKEWTDVDNDWGYDCETGEHAPLEVYSRRSVVRL